MSNRHKNNLHHIYKYWSIESYMKKYFQDCIENNSGVKGNIHINNDVTSEEEN